MNELEVLIRMFLHYRKHGPRAEEQACLQALREALEEEGSSMDDASRTAVPQTLQAPSS